MTALVTALGNPWDSRGCEVPMVSNLLIIQGFLRVLIPPFGGSNPSTPARTRRDGRR